MINTRVEAKSNSSGNPVVVNHMAASSRQSLSATERKTTPARRLSVSKTFKNTTTINRRAVDPFEKRLNHIRIHILNNTKLQHKPIPPEPTLIFENFLYLGGLRSLQNKSRLIDLNITHILSVIRIRPKKDYLPPQVKHLFIEADDCFGFNMASFFEQAGQFIDEARQTNGHVLVHCACGVSRSTTLCCAYLMKYHSMSLEQALIHIRAHRHIVQPNTGFLRQLLRYNEKLESDKATMNIVIEKLENI